MTLSPFQLQISAQCSELYCDSCWQRLHDTFQSIQLFRNADEFWKRHLHQEETAQSSIDTAPIEEIKIEPSYENEETGYMVEYLNHVPDDVIFTEERITVVDGIVKPEDDKTSKNGLMYVDSETANHTNFTREFACGKCDKGMLVIHNMIWYAHKLISFLSVQNCKMPYRTQICNA